MFFSFTVQKNFSVQKQCPVRLKTRQYVYSKALDLFVILKLCRTGKGNINFFLASRLMDESRAALACAQLKGMSRCEKPRIKC